MLKYFFAFLKIIISEQNISYLKRAIYLALVSMTFLFISSTARALIIFSNYSDNSADVTYPYYDDASGYVVEWEKNGYMGSRCAMSFTNNTGADQHLGIVSLAMYKYPDNTPANLTIRLVKDNGHSLPSTNESDIVETLAVDPAIVEDSESFLDLTSANNPLLLSGATYWVTAEPTRIDTNSPAQDALYYWVENISGSKFSYTYSSYGEYSGWFNYYNQPDPPNRFVAPTLRVVAALPPALSITLQGTAVIIQWSTNNANGFRLEAQNDLQSNSWSPIGDTPQLNGGFWKVNQSLDSEARFYRLVNP